MNINYFTGFDGIYFGDIVNGKQVNGVSDILEKFIDSLPHGSGIDCEWSGHMPKNGRYVYLTNSFHVMNDVGFYVGYQDFSIVIPAITFAQFLRYAANVNTRGIAKSMMEVMSWEFELQFNNGQYLANQYMLRDYIEDTIACALYDFANSLID